MSSVENPPLKTKESDGSVSLQPTYTLNFDSSDFNITKTGTEATITTSGSAGTIGGSITEGQIAFGEATANSIEGSANFTYNASQVNVGIGTTPSASVGRLDIDGTGGTNGVVRITNSGTGRTLQLTCTDDEGNAAPDLYLLRNSASPTAGDYLGDILFAGQDDGGNTHNYADIRAQIDTPDDGDEAGRLELRVRSTDATGTSLNSWIRLLGQENGTQDVMRFNDDAIDIDFHYEDEDAGVLVYFDASQKNVGIGGAPDSGVNRLHVQTDALASVLQRWETSAVPTAADFAVKLEVTATGTPLVNGAGLGCLDFIGDDSAGNQHTYVRLGVVMADKGTTSEDGILKFEITDGGTDFVNHLEMGNGKVTINEGGGDVDTRIEVASNSDFFKIDSGLARLGVGAAPTSGEAQFQVDEDATFNTYVIPKNEATSLLTGAEVKNTLITVDYNAGASTPTISSGTAGECVTILNLNATQTVTVTAGIGITFASTPAVLNQWESEKWVCYKSNNWVRVANES